MSNHFSAANLKFPGDDARLDLTDLFVFQAPANPEHHRTLFHRHQPGKTVLIIDANPFMTGGPEFHPDAVHRINVDNDGDLHADVAFSFTFSEPTDGKQTATAYYATGSQARQPGRPARCSSRTRRSASTPPRSPSRPAIVGCSSASAAIRSSPTPKAPCTDSSGPGSTRSPARTSSP